MFSWSDFQSCFHTLISLECLKTKFTVCVLQTVIWRRMKDYKQWENYQWSKINILNNLALKESLKKEFWIQQYPLARSDRIFHLENINLLAWNKLKSQPNIKGNGLVIPLSTRNQTLVWNWDRFYWKTWNFTTDRNIIFYLHTMYFYSLEGKCNNKKIFLLERPSLQVQISLIGPSFLMALFFSPGSQNMEMD